MDQDLDVDASMEDEVLTDEELCRLALAADPNTPLSDEAVPLSVHLAQFVERLCPGGTWHRRQLEVVDVGERPSSWPSLRPSCSLRHWACATRLAS